MIETKLSCFGSKSVVEIDECEILGDFDDDSCESCVDLWTGFECIERIKNGNKVLNLLVKLRCLTRGIKCHREYINGLILQYLCGGQHINNMATSPNEISSEEAEEREYVTSAKNQVRSIFKKLNHFLNRLLDN